MAPQSPELSRYLNPLKRDQVEFIHYAARHQHTRLKVNSFNFNHCQNIPHLLLDVIWSYVMFYVCIFCVYFPVVNVHM